MAGDTTLDRTEGMWGDPDPIAPLSGDERYELLGLLGEGGMGEVYRARDHVLNRLIAIKVVKKERASPGAIARFVEEAQATAQLQHPAIVPVHDVGQLPDGRWFFTMKQIRGRSLRALIDDRSWNRRRLVSALYDVAQAVAYAHSRGVVHRDLKPGNIVIGGHGEVQVIDWGLAKVVGAADGVEEDVVTDRVDATRPGAIAGTPAYMAPEQAWGVDVDERSDVYALGAVLHAILAGGMPYSGTPDEVLASVRAGPPAPPPGPPQLVATCVRAMQREPEDRFPSALGFAESLRTWLDGTELRALADAAVERAASAGLERDRLRQEARRLAEEARAVLAPVAPWADEADKSPGWALQDEAERMRALAFERDAEQEQALHRALELDAEHAEAHAGLLRRAWKAHREAHGAAKRPHEARMRSHLARLPADHPDRPGAEAWLAGTGRLALRTEVPARITLQRYVVRQRRLVLDEPVDLGPAPIDRAVGHGSYLCTIEADGRRPVRYPAVVPRAGEWAPRDPVRIPVDLADDEVFVPGGWFACGHPDAYDSLPVQQVWVDDFAIGRHPVTHAAYIAFLDALVAAGREEEALRHVPREPGHKDGGMLYGRDADGRFVLVPDADGDLFDPRWPAMLLTWRDAMAYCRWKAESTGLPYRLPGHVEWEKAARGVDGRVYPWGDFLDPSWANIDKSGPRPFPATVDAFPADVSPYGVRGMAGNVRDWCNDGPDDDCIVAGRAIVVDPPSDPNRRHIRGGCWRGGHRISMGAVTFHYGADRGMAILGFRVCRSV